MRLLGALLGFIFLGGFFGALIGFFVGGFFKAGVRESLQQNYQRYQDSGEIFFSTLFGLLGHMAKADGRVSEDEIAQAEAQMAQMGISGTRRSEAIDQFKRGSSADYDLQAELRIFADAARFKPDLKRNLVTFLVEMAMADGVLHGNEEAMLRRVAEAINIEMRSFEQMLEMLKAQHSFSGRSAPASADTLALAYQALGVEPSVSDQQLKRSYRKLMSQNHPDKMIAKGVPREMIDVATQKTQEIQTAYDTIVKHRKG